MSAALLLYCSFSVSSISLLLLLLLCPRHRLTCPLTRCNPCATIIRFTDIAFDALVQSVTFDQSDYPTILNFHLNGHDAPFKSITSVRGDMRPAASGTAHPHQFGNMAGCCACLSG